METNLPCAVFPFVSTAVEVGKYPLSPECGMQKPSQPKSAGGAASSPLPGASGQMIRTQGEPKTPGGRGSRWGHPVEPQ